MSPRRGSAQTLSSLLVVALLGLTGCVHKIHVTPIAPLVSERHILQTVRIQVSSLELEGADHRPGIILLEWPVEDLRTAITSYIRDRHTFTAVSEAEGSLTLTIQALLRLRSRETYRYTVRFEADLGPSGTPPVKTYVVEKEAVGSHVRWVTASDQDPIRAAVQGALDELLTQIEDDAQLYRK